MRRPRRQRLQPPPVADVEDIRPPPAPTAAHIAIDRQRANHDLHVRALCLEKICAIAVNQQWTPADLSEALQMAYQFMSSASRVPQTLSGAAVS